MWRFSAFLLLFLASQQHADATIYEYKGPVVCTGTKPLIIHEDYDVILATDEAKKQYYEQYWYQMYNHLHGCEIIVGNLILPHQHYVPFEEKLLNDAIANIEIVTGYIYIYDVGLSLNFKSLKAVYGNELFKFPPTWFGFDQSNNAFFHGYAIFVEKFTNETIHMPELRYIKNGFIGFKETKMACAWKPELEILDFEQMFDGPSTKRVFALDGTTFSGCGPFKASHRCPNGCSKCFDNQNCQKTTKASCNCNDVPKVSSTFCAAPGRNDACCPEFSHGGCSPRNRAYDALYCEKGYFLNIFTTDMDKPRICVSKCRGKIINGTDICLDNSDVCPDYMFLFEKKKCSYKCPDGQEMDPIGNFDLHDKERQDPQFKKYWVGQNRCKPCRMKLDQETKDFTSDCGAQCIIQSNSLSFVTILNIYPAITELEDYDFQKFKSYFTDGSLRDQVKNESHIFKKKCRHIFGFLHIDQYSVGYPGDAIRLIPEHFRILTYATGLYGNIRIENTEGYWFAEPFRNLLVIQKPIKGKIAFDQEHFERYGVTVRYNSDLRTVDLQRLRYLNGSILVQYNPLYIPPRKKRSGDNNVSPVFGHIKKDGEEVVSENGLDTTRTGKKITYDSGCNGGEVSFYYKRCVRCAVNEYRYFDEKLPKDYDIKELFAECKTECKLDEGEYIIQRDDEEQCLKCAPQCEKCSDHTPFTCYQGEDTATLACKSNSLMLDSFNIKACAPIPKKDNDPKCLNGFTEDAGKCVRCDSACRTCTNNGKDFNGKLVYNAPSSNLNKGCKGCGFVSLAKQEDKGGESVYIGVCENLGYAPRQPPGEKLVHYFVNNPVRNLYRNSKPSQLYQKPANSDGLDYGEAS